MTFIVITQDHFFFMGLRQSFPDAVQADRWSEQLNDIHLNIKRLSLIIDNRIPLKDMYTLIERVFPERKRIRVVVFEMDKGILYRRLTNFFSKYITVDIIRKSARLNDVVMENMTNFRIISFLHIVYLKIKEQEVIRVGMSPLNISEQAMILGCPRKTLYMRRNLIQKRLGFDSFIQTCNFVLRNRLL